MARTRTETPLFTFIRQRMVRNDYDYTYQLKERREYRYCPCYEPLQDSQLPVPVRCMAADLLKKTPKLHCRHKWADVNAAQWKAIRWFIFVVDAHRCVYCGAKATAIDHIWPVALGGSYHPKNCVAACTRCNSRKGGRPPESAGMEYLADRDTDGNP